MQGNCSCTNTLTHKAPSNSCELPHLHMSYLGKGPEEGCLSFILKYIL